MRSNNRKLDHLTRMAPAMGGATMENPGMNLAAASDFRPQRVKVGAVVRTHESGDSASRQTTRRTDCRSDGPSNTRSSRRSAPQARSPPPDRATAAAHARPGCRRQPASALPGWERRAAAEARWRTPATGPARRSPRPGSRLPLLLVCRHRSFRATRSGFDVLASQPKRYLIRWRCLGYTKDDLAV